MNLCQLIKLGVRNKNKINRRLRRAINAPLSDWAAMDATEGGSKPAGFLHHSSNVPTLKSAREAISTGDNPRSGGHLRKAGGARPCLRVLWQANASGGVARHAGPKYRAEREAGLEAFKASLQVDAVPSTVRYAMSVERAGVWLLIGLLTGEDHCGPDHNANIQPDAPVSDVPDIVLDPLFHQVDCWSLTTKTIHL